MHFSFIFHFADAISMETNIFPKPDYMEFSWAMTKALKSAKGNYKRRCAKERGFPAQENDPQLPPPPPPKRFRRSSLATTIPPDESDDESLNEQQVGDGNVRVDGEYNGYNGRDDDERQDNDFNENIDENDGTERYNEQENDDEYLNQTPNDTQQLKLHNTNERYEIQPQLYFNEYETDGREPLTDEQQQDYPNYEIHNYVLNNK